MTRLQISVVIPTLRRPALLSRCLIAVVNQRFDPQAFEVLVVDDGHDEATRSAVMLMQLRHPDGPRLRYLRPRAGTGPAVARNAGWRQADAGIIAFTDDDTVPAPDWLAQGLAAIGNDLSAVAGRVRVPPLPRPAGVAAACALPTDQELMTRGLERAEFVAANAFVRRSALTAIAGFDERFARAWREDSDLQFRLMAEVGPVGRSEALVFHPVRRERWGLSLRQQKNAYFDALLYKKHPRLYRERILQAPPWHDYAIVALTVATITLGAAGVAGSAVVSGALALVLVLRFAWHRIRATEHSAAHVVEMLLTSAAIPFLSVYWRLRGALHFRVLYL